MDIPTKAIRLANATTPFGEVLPVGTQLYDVATTKLYILTASALATDTITTAHVVEIGAGGGAVHTFGSFTYASAIVAPPATGNFVLNNAVIATATKLFLSDHTSTGVDVRGDLLSIRVGSNFKFIDQALATNSMNFEVTAITAKTGYIEYDVTHVSTSGTVTTGHTFDLENIPSAGTTEFTGLTDTPASYVGQAGQLTAVKLDESGLEFTTPAGVTHKFGAFTYAAAIVAPPPIGDFILNKADPTTASKLYISDHTSTGVNVRGDLLSMRVGSNFKFVDQALAANNMNFHISAVAGKTGYVEYDVDHVNTNGTIAAGHTFDLDNIPAATGGVTKFIDLTDTPTTYVGQAGKIPVVNAAENALDFITNSGGGGTPGLSDFIVDGQTTTTSVKVYSSVPFLVEQDGVGIDYPATPINTWTDVAVLPNKDFTISLKGTHLKVFKINDPNIKTINLKQVGNVTSMLNMFASCTSLETATIGDALHVTTMAGVFTGCTSLKTMTIGHVANVQDFAGAWDGCSSLTTFPVIDTSSGTNFQSAWQGCAALTTFPVIDTSSGTNFQSAWQGCTALTTFPTIDVSSGTNFQSAWQGCTELLSMSELDYSSGTHFSQVAVGVINYNNGAWRGCVKLKCLKGHMDFSSVVDKVTTSHGTTYYQGRYSVFSNCPALTAPPAAGTPVRDGDDVLAGTWTNPDACGEATSTPVADFTGTPVSGEVPLSVAFTDMSTEVPASWLWNFGDGNTSTDQNPHHTYTVIGTYTVTLIATNTYGSSTKVRTDYITVNPHTAPSPPPEIEIQLLPGKTSFGFATGSPFTVEQNGVVRTFHPGGQVVTGVNDASPIKVVLTVNVPATGFRFIGSSLLNAKLVSVGMMTSFEQVFERQSGMTAFECPADTSKIINFSQAWNGCAALTSFPAIDTSSGIDFGGTWGNCTRLVCIAGVLDFRALTIGQYTFYVCNAMTAPPKAGTPIRSGDTGTVGTWTNPNPCP